MELEDSSQLYLQTHLTGFIYLTPLTLISTTGVSILKPNKSNCRRTSFHLGLWQQDKKGLVALWTTGKQRLVNVSVTSDGVFLLSLFAGCFGPFLP